MSSQGEAFARHQQRRWLKPDAARWVRPDVARFLKPGTAPADVFPALQQKYSPSQPRVPAGNGVESGRWTSGESASGRPRVIIDTTDWGAEAEGGTTTDDFGSASPAADPMGNIDFGDISAEIQGLNLFDMSPRERQRGGVQLAENLPEGPEEPGKLPEIPEKRPSKSWERTAVARAVANWAGRATLAGETLEGVFRTYDWLRGYEHAINAARDPAKTLQELQSDLTPRPGYDKHHIVEKTSAQYWGYAKDDTEDPNNLVMIPRLKHWQITGWYGTRNNRYGGLSPREYLSDKSWAERRAVGLDALELFGVLQR